MVRLSPQEEAERNKGEQPIQPQQQVVEVEVNVNLLNQKINYLISKVEEINAKLK